MVAIKDPVFSKLSFIMCEWENPSLPCPPSSNTRGPAIYYQRIIVTLQVKETLTLMPLLNQLIQHKQLPVDNKVSAILLIATITQSIGSGYHDDIVEVRIIILYSII